MASANEPQSSTSSHAPQIPDAEPSSTVSLNSQKSLRRKYQKIRWKFKHEMQASNDLIKEEHRSMALARRLQEQIDDLLESLLDINNETRIPAHLRYDLRSPSPSASVVPSLETDHETDGGAGKGPTTNGITIEDGKLRSLGLLQETTPHTHYPAENLPQDLLGDELPGYMTPSHEEEYLQALDATLLDPTTYSSSDRPGKPIHVADKHVPTDRDLSVQNQDSAYNWLRRYQPQVFLQDPKPDHENASEKSAPRAGNGRGTKRKSEAKREDEEMEDEPVYVEPPRKSRKSKGGDDDDTAYRPGGPGGKKGKRKREDAGRESTGSTRKKARNSGA